MRRPESIILRANIETPFRLFNVLVIEDEEGFLVTVHRRETEQSNRWSMYDDWPSEESVSVGGARMYAFDRKTGKPRWLVPVEIPKEYSITLGQPRGLPFIVLSKFGSPQRRRGTGMRIRFLDKRTGRIVQHPLEVKSSNYFEIVGNRKKGENIADSQRARRSSHADLVGETRGTGTANARPSGRARSK